VEPICKQAPSHEQTLHTGIPHILQINAQVHDEPKFDQVRVTHCPVPVRTIQFACLESPYLCLNIAHIQGLAALNFPIPTPWGTEVVELTLPQHSCWIVGPQRQHGRLLDRVDCLRKVIITWTIIIV
jgi:hypothetical protein